MTARCGIGNDIVFQEGAEDNDIQYVSEDGGNDWINQEGGAGNDDIYTDEGGGNGQIFQRSAEGDDTIGANGDSGDDSIIVDAGDGTDTITYLVHLGEDVVFVYGGPGTDTLNVSVRTNDLSFTVVNPAGTVLYQSGEGGTLIVVTDVESLNGCPVCSGDTVVLKNVTVSGTDCQCNATTSITIGPGVTVKSGATVTFKAPTVKLQPGFHAENGSKVHIKQ